VLPRETRRDYPDTMSGMEYKDYYKIMEVARDASQDEIKRAYRKLARKYHPDVSKEPNAEQHFKEIGEAYEVLKDPEKRVAYDHLGDQWKAGDQFRPPPDWNAGFEFSGGFGGGGDVNFSDFFESLFGGQAGTRNTRSRRGPVHGKGQDHHAKIRVSIEDAYQGATRSIQLQTPDTDAQGHIHSRTRSLNVKIPKGVTEGQKIRLNGQGAPGLGGGKSGDLYLEIMFEKHRWYRIEGRDLSLDLPITPWEAALGATVAVPTLGGPVDMKLPPNSQSGRKLRLKGRGLPSVEPGDLYVILQIVIPPADSESARLFYAQMAEQLPFNPRAEMLG